MKKPILQAKNITKRFYYPSRIEILRDISLDIFLGQSISIMGTSGEGKTSLLNILGALDAPCSGSLLLNEKPLKTSKMAQFRNQNIGFVFQGFHLLEHYTVLENILMPLQIARKNTRKNSVHYQYAMELIAMVGLSNRCHFPTHLLSGGEKQRTAIARALCNDPDIILADEPSGNLDHHTSQEIYDLLHLCVKKKNKALVVVTHDLALAKSCDSNYQLRDRQLHLNANLKSP